MYTLESLAEDAGFAVSDLLDEERWDWFDGLSDIEKIQWRYCHADCSDFARALSEITGWSVIGISNSRQELIHLLVESPDGRMLDAKGWVTVDDLKQRYRLNAFDVVRGLGEMSLLSENEDFYPLIASILQLPVEPFTDVGFQEKTHAFCERLGVVHSLLLSGVVVSSPSNW